MATSSDQERPNQNRHKPSRAKAESLGQQKWQPQGYQDRHYDRQPIFAANDARNISARISFGLPSIELRCIFRRHNAPILVGSGPLD